MAHSTYPNVCPHSQPFSFALSTTSCVCVIDIEKHEGASSDNEWEAVLKEICPRGNNKVIIYFLIS